MDKDQKKSFKLHFLGTGNAQAWDLGQSAAVLEQNDQPILLIDCGPTALPGWKTKYSESPPPAVFITHCHLDHIAGLEALFYLTRFRQDDGGLVRLYLPVDLIPLIQQRIADYPNILAEGGCDFWEVFQLIPVSNSFWWQDLKFNVFPVRHHDYRSAFGLALAGHFLYTGDTKPIPEILNQFASKNETIFHDCGIGCNPSHTCVAELDKNYNRSIRERLVLYHYESTEHGEKLREMGFKVAERGRTYAV